jgi:hypothetical protein
VEETGVSLRAKTGTPWAPRGQTPLRRRVRTRRALFTGSARTLAGKLDQRQVEQASGATARLIALDHFQRSLSRPMSLSGER